MAATVAKRMWEGRLKESTSQVADAGAFRRQVWRLVRPAASCRPSKLAVGLDLGESHPDRIAGNLDFDVHLCRAAGAEPEVRRLLPGLAGSICYIDFYSKQFPLVILLSS